MGPRTCYGKMPHQLRAGSRAASGNVTVDGMPYCENYCKIFIVCTQLINMAAGRITRLGGPRVEAPRCNGTGYKDWLLRGKVGRCIVLTTLPHSCADWLGILGHSTSWSSRGLPYSAYGQIKMFNCFIYTRLPTAREDILHCNFISDSAIYS
jgi:hypothetical protein